MPDISPKAAKTGGAWPKRGLDVPWYGALMHVLCLGSLSWNGHSSRVCILKERPKLVWTLAVYGGGTPGY